MKTYTDMIQSNVNKDNSEMYKKIKDVIEHECSVKVFKYEPKINYTCSAIINDIEQQIKTNIIPTVTGDVIEIISRDYDNVVIDISMSYDEQTKMLHDRIRLGEYLLDMCNTYIQFPSILK